LHAQRAAGDLQISQPVSLVVPCDLVNLCPELLSVLRRLCVPLQSVQQFFHPLDMKGGAEKAGKKLPLGDRSPDGAVTDSSCLQILLKDFLTAEGKLFQRFRISFRYPREINASLSEPCFQLCH